MFIKNIHVSLCSINLCLVNSPGKKCIWKRICQIHQIRWIKYKYKYMAWNLIKYKYKYKYTVFVFVFVFANTNTYLTPALIRRQNSDKVINNNGRKLIDMCKMCNLRIANGRLGHDAGVGNFTCQTYNGQSCVDYVLFSPNLINDIEMFTVEPQTQYSDHCPVTFMLKCDMLCMFTGVNLANGQNRMIWDIEKKRCIFKQPSSTRVYWRIK